MSSNAIVGLKSELDLFTTNPIQLAVEDSSFLEIYPVASLNDSNSSIEFLIGGSGESYLDLAHCILHLQVSIKKKAELI